MTRRYTVEGVGARREQVVLGAVAAAVLVAIVAFAATGGGVRNQQPTPTPTPQPTPAADRDLFGGSLEPGVRYRTRAFVPALSFEVADTEWLVRGRHPAQRAHARAPQPDARPGSERPPDSFLTFSRITEVYDPRTGRVEVAPADLHAWMRRHPDLRVGPREAGDGGRRAGRELPRRACASGARRSTRRSAGALLLTCTAINPQRYFPDGAHMRTIVLRTEPDPLVIDLIGNAEADAIEAPPSPCSGRCGSGSAEPPTRPSACPSSSAVWFPTGQ